MAEITNYKSVSVTDIMKRLDTVKHNPSTIQRATLELLDEITEGQVDVVDPTNPFVFLIESSAVNTALAINENIINLRKQYPSLAQTEEDLYNHLSDNDFINRFSTPASANFTVVMMVNDILNKMIYDPVENSYKAIIPRDTEFVVDNYTFTLQYPIVVRKYQNDVVQVSYDADVTSPLETLSTNVIDYTIRRDSNGIDWMFFSVKVKQMAIESSYFPLQKSIVFSQDINYSDRYYYLRAYYRNTATGNQWREMLTTHSEQVHDPFKPTIVVKVFTGYVNVSIPMIYLNSGLVSGDVRFDVYNTKGKIAINLSNFKMNAFQMNLKAIDEERDIDDFTNILSDIAHYAYTDEVVAGGTNGIDFQTLRERVIFNTTGEQQIPIVNIDIQTYVNNRGFDLVKNIDTVTNRVFLAAQKLPKPMNERLTTSANIGINTYVTNLGYLKTIETVKDNLSRITLLSNNLFLNTNGKLKLITRGEIEAIKTMSRTDMINLLNNSQYLYNPFYYVLDSSQNEFEMRAYNLDYPLASDLSFVSQNQTLQLPVNTGSYQLEKTDTGYRFTIVTKSGNFYKQLEDGLVYVQLAFFPSGERDLAYINGTLTGTANGERVYTFELETDYDIDPSDRLRITNARMFSEEAVDVWIDLHHEFNIIHATSSLTTNFTPDAADAMLGKFLLPANASAVTRETIVFEIGKVLKNLWSRSRSIPSGLSYKTYDEDVPLYYDQDVYNRDPDTGAIFEVVNGEIVYNILHQRNDPVLDEQDNQVYKHRKGDIMLDDQGNPITDNDFSVDKELDILFVDGKHYFVDDLAFIDYGNELVGVLDTWITEEISSIQDKLLEQSRIYFYPKTTLGEVRVYIENGGEDYIASEQSLKVDLYVRSNIYDDANIRDKLTTQTIKLLDSNISELTVNMTDLMLQLKDLYGDSVVSMALYGLGGDKDYRIVTVANEQNRLCLKKTLQLQQDNTLIIKEDVAVSFFKVT